MIGHIKIYQQKKQQGTNLYVIKFDKNCIEILDTKKLEVSINREGKIVLFKPSLNTSLAYNIRPDETIRVSTNDAYIDLTGTYYMHSEEDDSLGFELIKN